MQRQSESEILFPFRLNEFVSKALHSRALNSRLAIDDAPQVLEGKLPAKRIVLMEFKDEAALQEFYHSEEYQSAIPIRHENAETPFLISINGLTQD